MVETIEDRDNIIIRDKKQKNKKLHKDRLKYIKVNLLVY